MKNGKKKRKSPLWWALGFLVVTVIAALIIGLGILLDTWVYKNSHGYGHPGPPVFTFLAIFAATAVFTVGNLIVLIILIIAIIRSVKRQRDINGMRGISP